MELSKDTIKYLDTLSNKDLLLLVIIKYQSSYPIWTEISKDEYQKNNFEHDLNSPWTMNDICNALKDLCKLQNYKKIPHYKDDKKGLFAQMVIHNEKPDYYTYYKQTGTKHCILLNSGLINYLEKRKLIINGKLDISYLNN